MAARMEFSDEMFRVPVKVHYFIHYQRWQGGKYVKDKIATEVNFEYCLGPYGSESMAKTQTKQFLAHYNSSTDIYLDLAIEVGQIERARWISTGKDAI